ncbi:MAG: sulfite exporter TauE/SafE family protein [Planctomycetota bacterium]|jgi:uncharacterized membrane protein YfcA
MDNHPIAPGFRRAAAAAGALICIVVLLAMFSGPTAEAAAPPAGRAGSFRFTAESVFGLMVVGLVSSTFGGMLAMGGGVFKMSLLLLFFGFHPGISKFAALLAYFVVAAGASYRYVKLRLVMMRAVKILVPSSTLGIILGAIVGHHLPRDVMITILGVFLLVISVIVARRTVLHRRGSPSPEADEAPVPSAACPPDRRPRTAGRSGVAASGWRIALSGLPGGFFSALLGISGGVVTTPLQQVLARIPIRNAVANTLLKASFTVPVACLIIMAMGLRAGHFDFWTPVLVALCLIPGSIVGSQLGPALNTRMSSVAIHVLFCAVALSMGIHMLLFGG